MSVLRCAVPVSFFIAFTQNTVQDQLNELGIAQSRLSNHKNILVTRTAAEQSVANRFGAADLAREQVEHIKLQLFNQLATARTVSAQALLG